MKPGEEAEATVRVSDRAGRPVVTALGVAVTDAALQGLFRSTDKRVFSEYGDPALAGLLEARAAPGTGQADLLALPDGAEASNDLARYAEMLFAGRGIFSSIGKRAEEHSFPYADLDRPFLEKLRERMSDQVSAYFRAHATYPATAGELLSDTQTAADPWGTPYRFRMDEILLAQATWDGKQVPDRK
ncbi:MAG: hypothetical protein ACKV2V_16355 [Blastocatellia bacterium]